ncbi:MAG TPA: hypothetical protein VK752_11855 [Bryobacteraceae bacterium]|jgi:hypothetical protein|nr:hypothetical protein [Bryobacteraceae bacterium]
MRYRVAFTKREESTMRPSSELDLNLSDGVVAEKVLVEELDSEAEHGEDGLDEDDSFLGSAAAEVWEYEVVDARKREFEDALQNSDLVLESEVVDDTVTEAADAAGNRLGTAGVYPGRVEPEDTELS